ncbi:MAG: hypothetical protein JW850_10340 [Thermoflexales bacterium]|nr:hypothetical protein [Thermoflexales bacterium]
MQQLFGDFIEEGGSHEYLVIHFSPLSIPLQQRWRNNGLSADFLAEYWVTFFPSHDVPSRKRQLEVKSAINYIANELLENVMKFSYEPASYSVSLGLYLYQAGFRFYARNAIDPQTTVAFQARINKLLTQEPEKLYIQQLEENALAGDSIGSHLGLLTMIHDYNASLAWKFETVEHEGAELTLVTTMVSLLV